MRGPPHKQMKTKRLTYVTAPNAGDLLNEYICRDLFGIQVKRSSPLNSSFSAIGSCLHYFQQSADLKTLALQKLSGLVCGDLHVWGTGFIRYAASVDEPAFFRRNTIFHAVRGNLSKARVERIIRQKLDIPVCDGGILTSLLFEGQSVHKQYSLGIIPHYRQQHAPYFAELHRRIPHSTIVDLKADPMAVYRKIAECECVISSSLHGLIIADSFHIPNLHVSVNNDLRGDGFKFFDYYSGYGIQHEPFEASENAYPDIAKVFESYKIVPSMVEAKKAEMLRAFPFSDARRS